MSRVRRRVALGVVLAIGLLSSGCSHQPERIESPAFDAAAAGKKALELYDTNKDGILSDAELDQCPPLKNAAKRYNGADGKISAESIAARVAKWNEERTGVFTMPVSVRFDTKALEDATVTFDPEPFLVQGTNLAPVSGKSDKHGQFIPKLNNQDRKGLPPGLYRVRVSKLVDGKESIPARYNTNTTLGVEIASDSPDLKGVMRLDLKSK